LHSFHVTISLAKPTDNASNRFMRAAIFYLEDVSFEIENYYLDVAAHEEALNAAGFGIIRWHAPSLSPQGKTALGSDFWMSFLDYPPITLIECTK
jgi:hypothetical protein